MLYAKHKEQKLMSFLCEREQIFVGFREACLHACGISANGGGRELVDHIAGLMQRIYRRRGEVGMAAAGARGRIISFW